MATPTEQVRLLIADVDTDNEILTDLQIAGFLEIEAGSVKRAAASALEAIARSEALVSKVIKTQDLSTDGAKVAAELRASAKDLRAQAETDEDDLTGWDVIDFIDPALTAAEATELQAGGF